VSRGIRRQRDNWPIADTAAGDVKQSAKVGLRKVAEVAGVSTATVSRAMNRPGLVSAELRERIASVVERLGWVPDAAARALATRRTGTIGAVFPTLTQGDFARAIEGLQDELTQSGYTLLLACSEYDIDQEYRQVRKLVERGSDAVLLVGELHHHDLRNFLARHRVPSLNTFVYNRATHGSCVGPDNHGAMFRMTNYLIDLGHRRFGVIAQATKTNDRAKARLDGINDALSRYSLAIRPEHFAEGRWTIREGRDLFRKIMAPRPTPTAVICGNAYLTVGAMLESQTLGIEVPASMSIVGYDDIEIMSELPIPITTLRVNSEDVGRRAARHAVSLVEGRETPTGLECAAEIVVRQSSGPPPADASGDLADRPSHRKRAGVRPG
jgi:LacI family transcriptional regulator